jgi:flagellar hook-basal body complex protein FliE
MSQMQIDQVLAQIRAISSQASALSKPTSVQAPASGPGFGELLKKGIAEVDAGQKTAATTADAYERGVKGVDLAQVMLETQKASVSFRALTEVRNRMVTAYQDVMNMSI